MTEVKSCTTCAQMTCDAWGPLRLRTNPACWKPPVEQDCNTCRHHQQGVSLADVPTRCLDCHNSGASKLRHWEPLESLDFTDPKKPPLDTQVGGDHYKGMKIQPIEFCMVNGLNACESKVIKYVTRRKGDKTKRLEDLDKAIHVIGLYKQMIEEGKVQ